WAERLHLLPTLWFRNTWTAEPGSPRPVLELDGDAIRAEHPTLGTYVLQTPPGGVPLFCENETNAPRIFGAEPTTPDAKDGIHDPVLCGHQTVSPALCGTKAAWWYQADVAPGQAVELRLRLREQSGCSSAEFETTMRGRQEEADEFYAAIAPADISPDEAL